MTVSRNELQITRNELRIIANSRQWSSSVGRAANQAATALDQLDAVLAREEINSIYTDPNSPGPLSNIHGAHGHEV